MKVEQEKFRNLYKRLLDFYPRTFREQLAESMEQTFNDLCNEKRQDPRGLWSFALWTFGETAVGIFREHLLLLNGGDIMQTMLTNLRSSALIGFLSILPFLVMEVVNRQNFRAIGKEDFPFPLFGILWFGAMLFVLTGMPILRTVRAKNDLLAHPVSLLLRIVVLVALAWAWGSWIVDQWPCFIGVPNCD